MRIAIIGAGSMGGAMARGLSGHGHSIAISNPSTPKLDALKNECGDIETFTDNRRAVFGADLVVLAVKPYVVGKVVDEIRDLLDPELTIVASLAAPITLQQLSDMICGDNQARKAAVLKIIPNTAISVGESMTFVSALNVTEHRLDTVTGILKGMGEVAVIPETLMPAATALCSCGIAFAMRYIRAAVEGAVELGIRPADALRYEIATLKGACALLESSGNHPEAEIDKVTTPGGITIKGLNAMERNNFTTAVIEGLKAAAPH